MKKTLLIAGIVAFVLSFSLLGCQSTGTPATQPSLATVTTQAEAALDVAVNVIHIGLDLKLIDGATYWRDIDPVVTAAQASCATLRADAAAGDVNGANAAANAVLAAVAKLQPYVSSIQAKAAAPAATKASPQ